VQQPINRAAFALGLAVHAYLAAQLGGEIPTHALTDNGGQLQLIPGDHDFLIEAIVEHGPCLRAAGHGALVDGASALVEITADIPALEATELFEQLMALAEVEADDYLRLAAPPPDRGDTP
jgi:hypothetical protein